MALGRRRKICRICSLVLIFVSVFIYVRVSIVDFAHYQGNKPGSSAPPCFETEEFRDFLLTLAYKVHLLLDGMGVEHWLMYGSLWGPLRGIQGPLPWDFDVDYGINGSNRIFTKRTLEEFRDTFTSAGMTVTDRLESSASFTVYANGTSVDLFLYYDHGGVMMRGGYEPWLFYINYRLYHSFPSRLVEKPLPKVKFGSFNISVPRGGMAIMKHLYRFNWWKVVKPVGCE